jgi:hypothetical protein
MSRPERRGGIYLKGSLCVWRAGDRAGMPALIGLPQANILRSGYTVITKDVDYSAMDKPPLGVTSSFRYLGSTP